MNNAVNGVVLFGTAEVARTAIDLFAQAGAIVWGAPNEEGATYDEQLHESMRKHLQEWKDTRHRFTDAVRADVAPDKKPIDWGAAHEPDEG